MAFTVLSLSFSLSLSLTLSTCRSAPAQFHCVRSTSARIHAGTAGTSSGHLRGHRRNPGIGFRVWRVITLFMSERTRRDSERKSVHGRTGQYLPVKRHYTVYPHFQDFSRGTSFIRPADPLCFRTTTNRRAALACYQWGNSPCVSTCVSVT